MLYWFGRHLILFSVLVSWYWSFGFFRFGNLENYATVKLLFVWICLNCVSHHLHSHLQDSQFLSIVICLHSPAPASHPGAFIPSSWVPFPSARPLHWFTYLQDLIFHHCLFLSSRNWQLQGIIDQFEYIKQLKTSRCLMPKRKCSCNGCLEKTTTPNTRASSSWFQANEINVMKCPAQSQDLNPIEKSRRDIKNTDSEETPSNANEEKLWNVGLEYVLDCAAFPCICVYGNNSY